MMRRAAYPGNAMIQYCLPMGLMGLVGVLVLVGTPDSGLSASVNDLISGTLGISSNANQKAGGASALQVSSFGTQSLSAQQAMASGGSTTPTVGNGSVLPDPTDIGSLPPNSGFGSLGGSPPTETGGETSRAFQPGGGTSGGTRGGKDPVVTPNEPSLGYCNTDIGACTTGGIKLPTESGGSMTVPPRMGGDRPIVGGSDRGYVGHLPGSLLPGGLGEDGLPTNPLGSGPIHASESGGTTNLTTQGSQPNNGGLMINQDALNSQPYQAGGKFN